MKKTLIFALLVLPVVSCSNSSKAEEKDRRNLYLAEFFYDSGAYGKSLESAKKVKKSSPRYQEAQEWIQRIQMETLDPVDPAFSDDDLRLPDLGGDELLQ